MTDKPAGYSAYLLRLLPNTAGGCRVTLENAHTGERVAFASVAHMAAYLERLDDAPGQAAGPEDGCAE